MDEQKKDAESMPSAKDKAISEITERTRDLSLSPTTYFVISTIARVPDDDSDSDSSGDGTFSEEKKPFTTTRPKGTKTSEISIEDLTPQEDSVVVAPFLKKLLQNGFEETDEKNFSQNVSVSIGLNRMKSLSKTKNELVRSELNKYVETSVRYEKFGFYWICNWYSTETNEKVEYETVRHYYEQLLKKNPKAAKNFRKEQEKNVPVPFRKLRDHAKNHDKTKQLVKEFREKNCNSNVYLSLIDINTVDFNGIYSAYLRIVPLFAEIPTVMTTGYEYPDTDLTDGNVYHKISEVDRKIRKKTADHIPLGVYYPEANMCILIPQGKDTLPESFEFQGNKYDSNNKKESPCLIKNIQKRRGKENTTFIFSDDKPLIISIPDKARKTKVHKTPTRFSSEFKEGASPSKQDLKLFKQVTQNHLNEKVWADALFMNGAIEFKKTDKNYVPQSCKSLIARIRNSQGTTDIRDEAISTLKVYIENNDVDAIVNAIDDVKQCVEDFAEENVRSEQEDELIRILKEQNISNNKRLLLLSSPVVLRLLREEIMSASELTELDEKTLECVCNEDIEEEIKQMAKEELSTYIRNIVDPMKQFQER